MNDQDDANNEDVPHQNENGNCLFTIPSPTHDNVNHFDIQNNVSSASESDGNSIDILSASEESENNSVTSDSISLDSDVESLSAENTIDNAANNIQYEQNEAQQPEERDETLYVGAQISAEESDLLIMSFIVRWNLEDKGVEDLLRLINFHMPASHLASKYKFLQKFPTSPYMKIMYICPECNNLLPDVEEVDCACGHHCVIKDIKKDGNFFIQLSITEQIQQILSNSDLVNLMRKECQDNDVINSKVYKQLKEKGVISNDDITLQWNTDGIKPFKSSKATIWPIQASINELPFHARRDNIILCGLYYGMVKPNINAILKPFVTELEKLHLEGMNFVIAGKNQLTNIKVHVLLSSVDSVARPMLQGINQFNGRHGCSFCLRRGRRIIRGKGSARIYSGGLGQGRNMQQYIKALERLEAYNRVHRKKKKHIQGVTSATILLLLPLFNIIKSFVPDYLHAVLEGTVNTFLKHWNRKDSKNKEWHLNKMKRRILSERLLSIKPPVEITRAPRDIDKLALWKASELRSFLLYYSLICLKGLLPNKYLNHWLLFVYSMTIFLREQITRDDFIKAEAALNKFVSNITHLYSGCQSLYTFNTHLLLHIPKAVENFGGLWASSTFPYEHFNGVLTRFIKGTQNVPQQICRSFLRLQQISSMSVEIFSRNGASQHCKQFYKSMLGKYGISHHSHLFSEGLRLFGASENYSLSLMEKITIQDYLGSHIRNNSQSFRRLIYHKIVIHANAFSALTVRNNSIVKDNEGNFLDIERILIVENINSGEKYCILLSMIFDVTHEQLCRDRDLNISSTNIFHVCQKSGRIIVRLSQDIICKCVCVPYKNYYCIMPLVNNIERD